jgi:hypothetical protein
MIVHTAPYFSVRTVIEVSSGVGLKQPIFLMEYRSAYTPRGKVPVVRGHRRTREALLARGYINHKVINHLTESSDRWDRRHRRWRYAVQPC